MYLNIFLCYLVQPPNLFYKSEFLENKPSKCKTDSKGYYYDTFSNIKLDKEQIYCNGEGCANVCDFNNLMTNYLEDIITFKSKVKTYDIIKCTSNNKDSCNDELKNRWKEFSEKDYNIYSSCITAEENYEYNTKPISKFNLAVFDYNTFFTKYYPSFILYVSLIVILISSYLMFLHNYLLLLLKWLKCLYKKYIVDNNDINNNNPKL